MERKYTEEDLRKAFKAGKERIEYGSIGIEKDSLAIYHNEPKYQTFEDYLNSINTQVIGTL